MHYCRVKTTGVVERAKAMAAWGRARTIKAQTLHLDQLKFDTWRLLHDLWSETIRNVCSYDYSYGT